MMAKNLLPVIFLLAIPCLFSSPLYSPSWGFTVDLPEDYEYQGGDGKDQFSFENPDGAKFDIRVYGAAQAQYSSVEEMAKSVQAQLKSTGSMDSFTYRGKNACLLELAFLLPGGSPMAGWALCVELAQTGAARPLLLAMAYGPAEKTGRSDNDLSYLHFSALDSIAPEESDLLVPGPITDYSYPREVRFKTPIFGLDLYAWIFEDDAEASQALIDREFKVLRRHENASDWQEAWIRFYRAIYRDSFDRLTDIAFQVERKLNVPSLEEREFADAVLKWIQSFTYERELFGSDFINLVSAAADGRGDCDNRSMLWAIVLKQAGTKSAIMVSRSLSHAMGLADLGGTGARFELNGEKLLVAETTADVSTGLINRDYSDIENWLGISFD